MVTRYDHRTKPNKITLGHEVARGPGPLSRSMTGFIRLDNLPTKEKFEEWTTPPEPKGLRPDTGLRTVPHQTSGWAISTNRIEDPPASVYTP